MPRARHGVRAPRAIRQSSRATAVMADEVTAHLESKKHNGAPSRLSGDALAQYHRALHREMKFSHPMRDLSVTE